MRGTWLKTPPSAMPSLSWELRGDFWGEGLVSSQGHKETRDEGGEQVFPPPDERDPRDRDQRRRPLRRHQLWSAILFPIPSPRAYDMTNLTVSPFLSAFSFHHPSIYQLIDPSIHVSICLPIFVSSSVHSPIFPFIYLFTSSSSFIHLYV